MLAKRFAPVVFGAILSGLMSLLVSGIATLRVAGLATDFINLWLGGWLTAWAVAFPVVLIVAPVAQRAVGLLISRP
jgi:uncharacterized protein DUF2798